jgi:two-component system, cell cycle sensor histidine kinase and response regulator CckA
VRQMQKMEALGRLAGGIAHDLNNILYPIIINTEMLLDEEGPGTTLHQPLRQILTAAYRQRDLVRQILAFSRRTEQKLKPVKIAPVIRESLKFLRASLPSTFEIRQDIPGDSDMILGDPTQIHQVVMNLCSNAADAMENQTGTIEVTLRRASLEPARSRPDLRPGRYLKLTVSDTGRGMEHEVLDHIFEPFYTTKEASRGSGMGLAVVHGIVKGHRGTISVESTPGKGSRFVVYLPLVDELCRQQEEASSSDHRARDKKQIMLVDDEEIVLSSVQRALERMGFQVVPVGDGKAALELFSRSPRDFDLIITDQTMPHLTGAQFSEEVLRIRPDMPVILCTGFSEVITEQEAKDMGIRELLMKPATTRDLGDAVNRALKG